MNPRVNKVIMLLVAILISALTANTTDQLFYSKIRIYISSVADIHYLQQSGLGLEHFRIKEEKYLDATLNNEQIDILETTGVQYEILIDDVIEHYNQHIRMSEEELIPLEKDLKEQFAIAGFEFGSMGGFYTYSEIVTELDSMRLLYPNLISVKQSIGLSIDSLDIWMVKISDNTDIDEEEPEVLYTALHHACEPQGMATVMYFMYYLLENYGSDPDVTFIVDNRELYFVPIVNPDGYVYNEQKNPNGGGMWRLNRRNNDNGSKGVDLNRNYGYMWGYNDVGSNPNPSSSVYRGSGPFSEPETQAIRDFCLGHNFRLAFNYHTYGNHLLLPWGYIYYDYTPDSSTFVDLAIEMTQYNNYSYSASNNYWGVTNGCSNDWMYGEQVKKRKIFAMTPEVGSEIDGFWPSPKRIYYQAEANVFPNLLLALGPGVIDNTLYTMLPEKYALHQNYPNPFNSVTTIHYDIPTQSQVSIVIYDLLGRIVRNLENHIKDAGKYSVRWNGLNNVGNPVSAGIYLYQLQAGEFVQTMKMVLMK